MNITSLDRTSPLPLWAQLEAQLAERLRSGEFADRFPTDVELTRQYDVSRHTVREAIRHLNSAGVLRRERGRGTVVNTAEFEQPLGTLYSLFQSVESTGIIQTSEVLRLELATNPEAAHHLELDHTAELVVLARLRLAGGSPLALDTAWLRSDIALPLLDVDFTHTALYDELNALGGHAPNQGWERLTPVVPGEDASEMLEIAAGEAAFALERLGQRDDRPIEWRTTIIRGDRFRYVSDWTAGSSPGLRPATGGMAGLN